MQGNVVAAARWLGASMILASVILVGGLQRVLSSERARLTEALDSQARRAAPGAPKPVAPVESAVGRGSTAESYRDRAEQMLNEAESLQMTGSEYERFWFLNQPSHMTPFRTHGGVN